MTLQANIATDLDAKTSTLIVTSGVNTVEEIEYSSNEITFQSRSDINITGTEFLDLIVQFNIFQKSLLTNFKIDKFSTTPFDKITTIQENKKSTNQWILEMKTSMGPRLIDYEANGDDTTVDLLERESTKIITFPEFVYVLFLIEHYRDAVKMFFKL